MANDPKEKRCERRSKKRKKKQGNLRRDNVLFDFCFGFLFPFELDSGLQNCYPCETKKNKQRNTTCDMTSALRFAGMNLQNVILCSFSFHFFFHLPLESRIGLKKGGFFVGRGNFSFLVLMEALSNFFFNNQPWSTKTFNIMCVGFWKFQQLQRSW